MNHQDQQLGIKGKNAVFKSSPQAVSSDSDDGIQPRHSSASQDFQQLSSNRKGVSSRLFAPFRSLGVVSSGRPFFLLPNQNSTSAMVCLPIGERFHMLQCDHLQPVLVSQAAPGEPNRPTEISHVISDSTLSIAVVGHGPRDQRHRQRSPPFLTLFARTKPIHSIRFSKTSWTSSSFSIVDLHHLGRIKVPMKGEKHGRFENAVVVSVLLAKTQSDDHDDGVLVVGNDTGDGERAERDSNESDSSNSSYEVDSLVFGEVAIFVATRSRIREQHRIPLSSLHYFRPRVAVHPATYVNKLVLGGSHVHAGKPMLVLLNIRSGKVVHKFSCLPNHKCQVTALEQSPAVDTIAVGTSSGHVHLINLKQDQLLFTLIHKTLLKGTNESVAITSLSFRTDGTAMRYGIAPLAVGRSDGSISIWDLTPPEESKDHDAPVSAVLGRTLLCEMNQVHKGGVSKIAFLPQEPLLLSIGTLSNSVLMHIFDSPDHSSRILRQRKGHTAPPKYIRYLHPGAGAGGGILANAADGTDAAACQILSSGGADRTLRVFSSARSVLDKEFSQGRGLEKQAKKLGLESTVELLLPPLIGMAACETRSRDWGDIVTIHSDHALAYVWSSRRGAQSGPVLRQANWNVSAMKSQPPLSAHATSLAISTCGNYAIVGTKGGIIYRYNIQSGIARGCYPQNAQNSEGDKKKSFLPGNVQRTMKALENKMKVSNMIADMDQRDRDTRRQSTEEQQVNSSLLRGSHVGFAVTGLAVDSVNKVLISVGADAKLILWNFTTQTPHRKSPFILPSAASKLYHVRDSDLAAIALEDYSALVFDCTSHSIVRRFTSAAAGPITDLGFSPDGRLLFVSSLDSTLRVWDVPTNACVDWMKFDSPVTSLTLSPTGEFLATTHARKLGINMWSDKSFYQTTHIDGLSPSEPTFMDDPVPIAETSFSTGNGCVLTNRDVLLSDKTKQNDVKDEAGEPAKAKEPGLITMSGLAPANWKNLFHLELVKERNKPREPPKKPPSAPFFLQWRSGESYLEGKTSGIATTGESEATAKRLQSIDEEEWNAVWSDDDDGNEVDKMLKPDLKNLDDIATNEVAVPTSPNEKKRETVDLMGGRMTPLAKKRKVKHYRSILAALLEDAYLSQPDPDLTRFQAVTDHMATLGPSAIDVSLLTLCSGMHDLEEGLRLLNLAAMWLCEACQTRECYEVVNAYLHRYLHLHGRVITGLEGSDTAANNGNGEGNVHQLEQRHQLLQSVSNLRQVQQVASHTLRTKTQKTLCLLRHFSRMV